MLAVLLILGGCGSSDPGYEVVLDGLNEPRGLWLRADGTLCVAEAGRLAEGQQAQDGAVAERADTGSVTCLDAAGRSTRVVEGLPYVSYNITGVTTGPADLAEVNGVLYLLTGEGEDRRSRALLDISDPASPPEVVADFLAFEVESAEPGFFDEIDVVSNPFAMIPVTDRSGFLVTDGATGEVLVAGLDGDIRLFSAVEGHEVLTGITRGPDGRAYVTSFSQLPHAPGAGSVLRFEADGTFEVVLDTLTAPIDAAFDGAGRLYVLEFVGGEPVDHPYEGRAGRLVRFEPDGDGWSGGEPLVEGLPAPTSLLIDAQGRIFVSVHGAFSVRGTGAVIRFDDLEGDDSIDTPIRFEERSPG